MHQTHERPGDESGASQKNSDNEQGSSFSQRGTRVNLSVRETAFIGLEAKLCVVPVSLDGEKKPGLPEWKSYQEHLPTREEVQRWFHSPTQTGIGVVTGAVSHNFEVLDFDTWEIFLRFEELARASGCGALLDRMKSGYCEQSPHGVHLPYRCEQIAGNQKLAQSYDRDAHGKPLLKTLIETRGEGGFIITAPSHSKVHESGKPYVLLSGSLATIPTITPEERADLFALARAFNEVVKDETPQGKQTARPSTGDRPGDAFNARATWEEVLAPHGWRKVYERIGEGYWRRPGKDRGVSATTNYSNSGLLYMFSSSTPFETERGYNRFSAFALLNYDNDFRKTAAALSAAGYVAEAKGPRKATRALRLRRQAEETARQILAKRRGEGVA